MGVGRGRVVHPHMYNAESGMGYVVLNTT